jgi:crotonobetainyl-CoA:carnitine CoA-transferase CaiB-like acyl-CoA transferase
MRVLEISDKEEAAAFAGKLFARWGAEVIKVESPQRLAPARHLDLYLNGGKGRVALDPRSSADASALDALAREADIVLTDYDVSETEDLRIMNLGGTTPQVRVSITPFGLSGPYKHYKATASTLLALGGYTWLMGDPGRAPLTLPGNYPSYQGGTFAYLAALSAYLACPRQPLQVEVSILECLASLHQFTDTMWLFGEVVRSRHGNRWENLSPTTLLKCADGWYGVNILANFWFSFGHMIGRPDIASEGPLSTNMGRMEHQDEVEAIITEALGSKPRKEIFKEGQEVWRVPVGHAATMADLLDDPHLNERGFWRRLENGVTAANGQPLLLPGSPFRVVGEPPPPEFPPQPPASSEPRFRTGERASSSGQVSAPPDKPLAGVRVLDLTRIWSGPLATRILGDLGAEVIKIEAPDGRGGAIRRPGGEMVDQPWNRQALFNKLSRNKKSISLDLKAESGREIFLKLVEKSDVVIENFSARAMPGLGLSYDVMQSVNPRIVYVPMPAYGLTGPYRDYIGLGPSIEPVTGMTAILGYSDEEPRVTSKAITDAIAGTTAAAAVVMAMEQRQRTGAGCMLDLSQHETGVAFLGEYIIEAQLSGNEPVRLGNGSPQFSPYSVYRCRGEDDWIAVAVRSDEEWTAFCSVVAPELREDSRCASLESRLGNRALLDEEIERRTTKWDKRELESALQAHGVAAGAVLSAPEWLNDRHLKERDFFVELEHAVVGRTAWDGLGVVFNSERKHQGWVAAPLLGEHNRSVLTELLGLSEAEIDRLHEEGVLATAPRQAAAEV